MPSPTPAASSRRRPTWSARRSGLPSGTDGAVAAQLVVAFPVLLMMVLAIVQYAVWSQAAHIAQAAAAQGLDQARIDGGTDTAGTAQAQQVLRQLDAGPLVGPAVTVRRDARTATVTITGTAETIVPFLRLPIRAEAAGDLETFTTP